MVSARAAQSRRWSKGSDAPSAGQIGFRLSVSRGITRELAGDLVELVREFSDSLVIVLVEAQPALDSEPSIADMLFDGRRCDLIVGEIRVERVGNVAQRVVADEIGHLEGSEHRDEGTQRGLDH